MDSAGLVVVSRSLKYASQSKHIKRKSEREEGLNGKVRLLRPHDYSLKISRIMCVCAYLFTFGCLLERETPSRLPLTWSPGCCCLSFIAHSSSLMISLFFSYHLPVQHHTPPVCLCLFFIVKFFMDSQLACSLAHSLPHLWLATPAMMSQHSSPNVSLSSFDHVTKIIFLFFEHMMCIDQALIMQ